jgi:perosamine synthetase
MIVPLSRNSLGPREEQAVLEVIRSGFLVQGLQVAAFEEALRRRLGVAHAVACSSGTAALHLALWALGIGPGDEVVVPALTFPAPANVTAALGATPVFADIEPDTWNVSPRSVAAVMSARTRAVIVVDQFGVPADVRGIAQLVDCPVIEDAACALGSSLGTTACGALGRIATLSFHPRKVVTTGEGGMILCSDAALVEKLVALRNHGMSTQPPYAVAGLNYRMMEVAAAIGRVQLDRMDGFLQARREIAAVYDAELTLPHQTAPEGALINHQTYGVLLPATVTFEDRDRVVAAMRKKEIEAQILSFANNLLPAFAASAQKAPVAEHVARRGIALPLHPAMTREDAARVVRALQEVLA